MMAAPPAGRLDVDFVSSRAQTPYRLCLRRLFRTLQDLHHDSLKATRAKALPIPDGSSAIRTEVEQRRRGERSLRVPRNPPRTQKFWKVLCPHRSVSELAMMRSLKTSAPQCRPLGKRRIRSGLIFSERDSGDVSGHGPRHRSFPTPAPASIHTSKSNTARRAVRCSPDAG